MNVSLAQHKENLESFSQMFAREKDCAIAIAPENENIQSILEEQKRKTEEAFKVLVVGAFNAGKSSMINAMAGRDFLPTGDLPETGVVTELIYGEEFRITLYPKISDADPNPQPVVLEHPTVDMIKKYCSIDNSANFEGEVTDGMKYERTVVECDIPILKEGIMLIDSVGMNDPWGNDYITEFYFPKADAIIYLMDCNRCYDSNDLNLLKRINGYGFRDLIIVYTKYSDVIHHYRRKPENELIEFKNVCLRHAAEHTDIGDQAVFFVDNLDAIEAKVSGDQQMLEESGFAALERFCSQYLVENKGRIKVRTLNNTMQKISEDLVEISEKVKTAAEIDKKELENRIREAERMLLEAEETKQLEVQRFETKIKNMRPILDASIRSHVSTLASNVNLDDYQLRTKLPGGLGKLNVFDANNKSEAIRSECQKELERRIDRANKAWLTNELPNQIQSIITDALGDIGAELANFYTNLDEIDAVLIGKHKGETAKCAVKDVVAGVAYSVLTGDFITGSMAITHGRGTMGKALLMQVGAGALVAAVGLPVTLPVLVIAGLASNIFSVLSGNNARKEAQIKSETVKMFRQTYQEAIGTQEAIIKDLSRFSDRAMDNAAQQFQKLLDTELQKKREEIQMMINESEKNMDGKNQTIALNGKALEELTDICEEGNQITRMYN